MKIIETANRTPTLLRQLLEVWERSVRATHLFLSDGEIRQIKQYVPQALGGIEHLIIAEDEAGRPARAGRSAGGSGWPCWRPGGTTPGISRGFLTPPIIRSRS